MSKLKMTLRENSVNFFVESVKKAIEAETATQNWKMAIFLLVQSIELILKERLKATHSILIYTNIDKPKHTVDLNLAIDRLANIDNVSLSTSDLKTLQGAAEIRNKIVHFEFDVPLVQIKSSYITLIGFYTSFCNLHLGFNVLEELTTTLHSKLMLITEYINELEIRAKDRLQKAETSVEHICECPSCHKQTFNMAEQICYLCSIHHSTDECDICSKKCFWSEMGIISNYPGNNRIRYVCKDCEEKHLKLQFRS